jgi:hypothetical protein
MMQLLPIVPARLQVSSVVQTADCQAKKKGKNKAERQRKKGEK